jgi:hypothetical protein
MHNCNASISISIFAGYPSITTPTAAPWLSPKEVMVRFLPMLFLAILCGSYFVDLVVVDLVIVDLIVLILILFR